MASRSYPVLYVDDEAENLVTFRYAVEDRFPVLTASSGDEALRVLEREKVAVLLSDQRMPGMSGVELCEAARRMHPEVVRIIITAYSDLQVAVAAINRGQVARYLTKPWRDDELLSLIDMSVDLVKLQETVRDMQVRMLQQGEPRANGELRSQIARQLQTPLSQLEINTEQVRDLLDAGLESWADAGRAREIIRSARGAHGELGPPLETLRDTVSSLSRRERLERSGRPRACDAARVARAVCKILEQSVEGAGELRVVLKAAPMVPMDPAELGHALTHLIRNAADSLSRDTAGPDGVITVTVDESPGGAVISVSDNGPGIAQGQLERIFDPYVSGDENRAGLGLAVVRQLVAEAGGQVEAESEPGGGARLALSFPLTG